MPARVSTGVDGLDRILGGLYWGENVVWQFDRTSVQPFYGAIAGQVRVFETAAVISLGSAVNTYGVPGLAVVDAAPGSALAEPRDLLREIHRLCHTPARRLLLFESLDRMVRSWGMRGALEFVEACWPLLLEARVIAYWSMSARNTAPPLRDAIHAAGQCVFAVDRRSVHVVKAEGRDESVRGTVFHWHQDHGWPVLDPPGLVGRVAASVREVRRTRELSQHDIGDLAGVTASAISQVERAERGLSLGTLVRLSDALGVTVDDLLRGHDPGTYRIGRRPDGPGQGLDHTLNLLEGAGTVLRADLVHLQPHQAGSPHATRNGTGILAVAGGLLQVDVGHETPAIRHGEILVADSVRVQRWRNLGPGAATAFWIVLANGHE